MVVTRSQRGATNSQVMSPTRDSSSLANSPSSTDGARLIATESPVLPQLDGDETSHVTRVERQLGTLLAQFGSVVALLTDQRSATSVPATEATPLPQRQLIQEFSPVQQRPRTQRVLTPYGPRRGNPATEDFPAYNSSAGTSTRQAELPRTPRPTAPTPAALRVAAATQPVQSETTGDRTDAVEGDMTGQHRCTRCMNASNHVAPNARLNNDNYKTWRAEMCTILDASNLLPPLLGNERLDDQYNDAQRKCFRQRIRVAQREIVMALSEELQSRFSSVIERADPLLLWHTLEEHFDNHPGINSVFLKRDMLNRRLQRDERLDTYIKAIDDFKHQLRRANQQLPEVEAVSILLSNTVGVYPAVVNEHEVRLARGEAITWEQAIERLRLAEHARQEAERQQGRGGRAVQRDIAFIGNSGDRRSRSGGRRSSSYARGNNHNRNTQGNRAHSRSRSMSPRGRNKRRKSKSTSRGNEDISKRKAKTKCNTCGQQGHWSGDPECRGRSNGNNNNNQPPRSMVDIVTVKNFEPVAPTRTEQQGAVLTVRGEQHEQCTTTEMIEWILDSGAQTNVSSDLTLFTELHEDTVAELVFGNGTTERATVGTVHMQVVNEHTGKTEERLLENVSYSKSAPYNLVSQTYMQFKGNFKVRVSQDQLITRLVKDSLKLRFEYVRGMYRMWTPRQSKHVLSVNTRGVENPMALLHNRLGHVGMDTIKEMVGQEYNFGIQIQQQSFASYECIPCLESKTKRMSYSRNPTRTSKPLEKPCVDLCSVGVDTISKANQFLLVVDEATRYRWGYLLAHKDEATPLITDLILLIRTQFPKHTIKMVFSDGGGEFVNTELETFCGGLGIETLSSNPYSPQENALVERGNQTVMRQVRSMLHATQMPISLWGEAFLHAIYTLNITPTQAFRDRKTPHEALHGRRPDLTVLRTWGCLVHAHIPEDSRQRKEKLSSQTQLCLLLGYSMKTKGYKLLNLRTGSVTTCRGGNMKAHEQYTVHYVYIKNLLLNTYEYGDHELPATIPIVPIRTTMQTYLELSEQQLAQRATQMEKLTLAGERANPMEVPTESATEPAAPGKHQPCATTLETVEPAVPVGASKRRTTSKEKLTNRVGGLKHKQRFREADDDDNWEPRSKRLLQPDSDGASSRPKRKRQQSARLKDYVVTSVTTLSVEDVPIPTSHKHASRSKRWKEWKAAMQVEMDSQRQHGTWTLVPRTEAKSKRVISCKWVYAIKRDATGSIKLYKAILVIRGFLQRMGIDYSETYAPVIRFETIRCVIVYALQRGWAILQFDVKTAFLYGDLDEEVYMEQPPGFGEDSTRYI